jgi:D-glucuronyl C5-epimerase-like protein
VSGGGWYFLYDFNFAPLGDTGEILRAPWYSGMAHGRALSVFVRLYQATRDPKWRTAADAASPASPGRRAAGSPTRPSWTVRRTCGSRSTRSPATLSERVLVKGTITTIKTPANSHHQMHVEQFPQLWQYTDDVLFITTANSYRGDYSKRPCRAPCVPPHARRRRKAEAAHAVPAPGDLDQIRARSRQATQAIKAGATLRFGGISVPRPASNGRISDRPFTNIKRIDHDRHHLYCQRPTGTHTYPLSKIDDAAVAVGVMIGLHRATAARHPGAG